MPHPSDPSGPAHSQTPPLQSTQEQSASQHFALAATVDEANRQLELYKHALDAAAIFVVTDSRGTITYLNDQFCQISGYSRETLIGRNHRILNSGTHPREFFRQMYKTISSGQVWHGEICNRNRSGQLYWVQTTIIPLTDVQGQIEKYITIRFDITSRKKAEEQLRFLAEHDSLTGLANHALLARHIEQQFVGQGEPFSVMYLDFDRFKFINDSLGHHMGDELLCAITDRLNEWVGSRGIAARVGGDEFAILLRDVRNVNHATELAKQLLKTFEKPLPVNHHKLSITASVGVIHSDDSQKDAEQLLRNADTAMYGAKRVGGGRICVFDELMRQEINRRLDLESELHLQQWEQQFHMEYQPIIDLSTGQPYGIEALARWNHPRLGLISPDVFIEMIEEIQLMVPMGAWVLHTACRQLAEWDIHLGDDVRPHLFVNLAKCQMQDPGLINTIRESVLDAGLTFDRLILEMTESNIMTHPDRAEKVLHQIKDLGVRVAMDDFGTGMSSLSLLHHLPIDILKIDRSFIWRMEQRRELFAIIQAISDMAQNLGMTVLAEGVENEDHISALQTLGCDFAQGYYFAKPLIAEDALSFIADASQQLKKSA